jgi:hypothetical protein
VSGRRLPRQHKAGHARPGEPFQKGGQVLAAAPLRVRGVPDVLVQLARGHGPIPVTLPPDGEQVRDRLPATVALLRLADPLRRVLAAQR